MDSATIIIPTYNEADNIPELVRRIRKSTNGVRILVVDDSPNDETTNAAWKAGCQVIHRKNKRGLASAVIDGLKQSEAEKYIVMDGDLQHPPEAIPKMLKALDSHSLVTGSRYCKGGQASGLTFRRKLVSRIANLLALPLAPEIKDRTTQFFGVRYEALPDLESINSTGYETKLELLVKGRIRNTAEVPIVFGNRENGRSKLSGKVVREYLLQLADLYWFKFGEIARFALVGASGAVWKLGILYSFTELLGLHYLASYPIAFVVSVSNNFAWNSLWTFKSKHSGFREYGRYAGITTFTLGINEGLMYLMTDVAGLWYMASGAIALLTAFVINYLFSRKWVWNKQK